MKIQTGYITKVQLPVNINVKFRCSKCKTINNISSTFYVRGERSGGLLSNPIKRQKIAVNNLSKKLKDVSLQVSKHNYRNIDLHCKCSHCGNSEIWTKYIFFDRLTDRYSAFLEKGGSILLVAVFLISVALITNIFESLFLIIPSIVSILLLGCFSPMLYAVIKNHLIQKKVDKLPKEFHPEIKVEKKKFQEDTND